MNIRDYIKAQTVDKGDKGLGDTVKRGLESVGIKQDENCKCKERQDRMNKTFPYKR